MCCRQHLGRLRYISRGDDPPDPPVSAYADGGRGFSGRRGDDPLPTPRCRLRRRERGFPKRQRAQDPGVGCADEGRGSPRHLCAGESRASAATVHIAQQSTRLPPVYVSRIPGPDPRCRLTEARTPQAAWASALAAALPDYPRLLSLPWVHALCSCWRRPPHGCGVAGGGGRSTHPFRGIFRLDGTEAGFTRWPCPRVPPLTWLN